MGKHRLNDPADEDSGRISGRIPEAGELKEQLAERSKPGEGVGESSQSPIETF